MVANIRCAEIAREQLDSFAADRAWVALAEEAAQDLVPGFGALAAGLMDSCVTGECLCRRRCCWCSLRLPLSLGRGCRGECLAALAC
jgi:hypothetical protein